MPSFSKKSEEKLETCHPDLQRLFREIIKTYDCTVLEGHRGEAAQTDAYNNGYSKTPWPESKHNKIPSMAVDVMRFPINFGKGSCIDNYFFAGYVMGVAQQMGIKLRWGGDWDRDKDLKDQNFYDLPHFELVP